MNRRMNRRMRRRTKKRIRRSWLIALVGIIAFSQIATAQILTPTHSFSFNVKRDVPLFLSGKAHIEGEVNTLPLPQQKIAFDASYFNYLNLSHPDLFQIIEDLLSSNDLRTYPLFAEHASIKEISKAYLVNMNTKEIVNFSNVKIFLKNCSSIVVGNGITLKLNESLNAIYLAGLEDFIVQLTEENTTISLDNARDYVIMSSSLTSGQISGEAGEGGIIKIEDFNGNALWSSSDKEWIAVIENSEPLILDIDTSFLIIPMQSGITIKLEESEENKKMPNVNRILERVSTTLPYDISIGPFSNIISEMSPVLNGICAVIKTNGSILINGEKLRFDGMGAIRFSSCSYSIIEENGTILSRISGKGKLLFLGNQVYTDIPVYFVNGFPIPLQPIFVWMLGIGIFILFLSLKKKEYGEKKVKKKEYGEKKGMKWKFQKFPLEINEEKRRMIKWISLGLHLFLIFLVFILFDFGFRALVGVSALSVLSSTSNKFIFGILLSIELLSMFIAYVSFALPTRIASYGVLEFIGIGKEGRGIGKSIGLIVMLLAGLPYITYVLNIIVMIIHPLNFVGQ